MQWIKFKTTRFRSYTTPMISPPKPQIPIYKGYIYNIVVDLTNDIKKEDAVQTKIGKQIKKKKRMNITEYIPDRWSYEHSYQDSLLR